ncbi:MAG: hypothetical protein JSR27_02005 [Proteobacteria bacterium]|nr:hypothetical protein [Pseudomonadota bacterium]
MSPWSAFPWIVACALPAAALAQEAPAQPVTFNVAVASQYVYRGLANSSGDPAVQAGLDYTNPAGFYLGAWGSNSSWITDGYAPDSGHSIEIDGYFGWRFTPTPDVSVEVGYQRYAFPGHSPPHGYAPGTTRPDTDEVHVTGGWKWITLSYFYTLGNAFGNRDTQGSEYLLLAAAVPLGDSGATLSAHVGRQRFSGNNPDLWAPSSACTNRCLSYTDFAIGADRQWFGIDFALTFTNTNARATAFDGSPVYRNRFGDNIGDSQWILSAKKTF